MLLGVPILIAMTVVLPCVSIYLLLRPLSLGMKLDAAFVGGLGIAFGWLDLLQDGLGMRFSPLTR